MEEGEERRRSGVRGAFVESGSVRSLQMRETRETDSNGLVDASFGHLRREAAASAES